MGMKPQKTVEDKEFEELVTGLSKLNTSVSVMSRRTLGRRVTEMYNEMVVKVKQILAEQSYVCTTADVWSSNHRSYMGITAHWIDTELKRSSVALACRRFTGSHTYDKIGEMLHDIHSEFDLGNKVVVTVTDNGSNFVKAFTEYGITIEKSSSKDDDDDIREPLEFVNVSDIMDASKSNDDPDDSHLFHLPQHHRCSSHTLSLIGTVDIQKLSSECPSYGRIHKSALAKCSAIWNKASRSPKLCEKYIAIMKKQPKNPCPTRWNSLYDSIVSLLCGRNQLKDLCVALEISVFKDFELDFLQEFVDCLKPIATSLDRLQGDENCYMGDLLPTILRTKQKLEQLALTKLSHCSPLVKALNESLQKRFGHYMALDDNVTDYIIASVTHPYFKLRWVQADKTDYIRGLFLAVVRRRMESRRPELQPESHGVMASSSNDDFFSFSSPNNSNSAQTENSDMECLKYLEDGCCNIESLNKYPLIRELFIEYNAAIPSSAPVERLFSYAGMVLTCKRACMSDANFEHQLLLKANDKYLRNFKLQK